MKKFRDSNRQFMIEGEKLVRDTINRKNIQIEQLVATESWMAKNLTDHQQPIKEIHEADISELSRISSFETPPQVIAVLNFQEVSRDDDSISGHLSIGLDRIQDPGNLGTIIRTADWFGIRTVFCGEGCAEIYNPKVIQASMGAIFNVSIIYDVLPELLNKFAGNKDYVVAGTFMQGSSVYDEPGIKKGMILFGNESQGISAQILPYITRRFTIPLVNPEGQHVESLNVASSVAVVLSAFREALSG